MQTGVKAALLSVLGATYGDGTRATASSHTSACSNYSAYVQAWGSAVTQLSEGDVVLLRDECEHFHRTFPGIRLATADIEGYVSGLKLAGSVVRD